MLIQIINMGSKIKNRQIDRRPKRFVPDYAPEKGASNARRAQTQNKNNRIKRANNPRNWQSSIEN